MEEMGDDESLALLASLIVAVVAAFRWYRDLLGVTTLGARGPGRLLLSLTPLFSALALWRMLGTFAAVDVREDIRYQFLFFVMGGTWVLVLPRALAYCGVSFRDDALERRNLSAALAISGTVLGLGALFTGSNMGEGPSIWNTVVTALAATGLFAAIVWMHALFTQFGDTIAVERDEAAGLRFGGFALASGLVLGRAAAGDWAGPDAMLRDLLVTGWPAFVFGLVAVGLERALHPTVARPQPPMLVAGVVPALSFLGVAVLYVASLPSW